MAGENEKIVWSLHAVRKLRIEKLRSYKVEGALKECVLIENYETKGRPLPDCLVLVFDNVDPIHAVIAIDEDFDRIIIVTVYRPEIKRWEHGWKKRINQD